jgi:hypothetical protein
VICRRGRFTALFHDARGRLALPFQTSVLGVTVTVIRVDLTVSDQIFILATEPAARSALDGRRARGNSGPAMRCLSDTGGEAAMTTDLMRRGRARRPRSSTVSGRPLAAPRPQRESTGRLRPAPRYTPRAAAQPRPCRPRPCRVSRCASPRPGVDLTSPGASWLGALRTRGGGPVIRRDSARRVGRHRRLTPSGRHRPPTWVVSAR